MTIQWKAHKATPCEDGKARTVYIRGEFSPFVGWMATPDTVWSVAAFIKIAGKRVPGYFDTETGTFRPLNSHAHLLGIRTSYDRTRFHRDSAGFCVWNKRRFNRGDESEERKLDIQHTRINSAQIVIRHVAPGWFQACTWIPGYRQERNNMPRANLLDLLRRFRSEIKRQCDESMAKEARDAALVAAHQAEMESRS